MPQTQYNLHLKGFVGGADFDRNYVDYVLAKNAGKDVNVLIDSLGGNLATALSIAAAFKNHGKVSVHFVGMNASAATIASMYAGKCKKKTQCLLDLMKVGGWLSAKDAREWILSQVGVAEIWQTSFSISEEFLRRLFFICKDKKVSRINLVLDHKATNKTLKLWAFITQVIERTYLADNHSKILLVRAVGNTEAETGDSGNSNSKSLISDSHTVQTVSVITSQNLTRGNRAESAFISTDPNIFASLYAQIEDLITNHSVPLNELFRQRITE